MKKLLVVLSILLCCSLVYSTVGYGDISPVTVVGRTLTVLLIFIPGIAVFSSLTGIMSASLSEVMELERDPNVDPIEEFLKEKKKHV